MVDRVIAVLGICITAALTVLFFILARQKKQISYWALATPILGPQRNELGGHLSVYF
jgi:hypothetical protein